MNMMRMPMFTWNAFVVQFLVMLAFPVITIALQFLIFDRFFGTNFYTTAAGADPLLWQHLFWIFGHPRSTSSSCRRSASSARCCRRSAASRSSATR
jgi:cytochrome c oxidase subunit 1